jgi:glycerol kinase
LNLTTVDWDDEILSIFGIPRQCLPKIMSSTDLYGKVLEGPLKGIPVTG